MNLWLSIVGIIFFAGIHLTPLLPKKIRIVPTKQWLSFAGGISVGYIFLEVLPLISTARIDLLSKNLS